MTFVAAGSFFVTPQVVDKPFLVLTVMMVASMALALRSIVSVSYHDNATCRPFYHCFRSLKRTCNCSSEGI